MLSRLSLLLDLDVSVARIYSLLYVEYAPIRSYSDKHPILNDHFDSAAERSKVRA